MGQYVQRTTLKQCENLTLDLLEEQLEITENEAQILMGYFIAEDIVIKKYIFQCGKCKEMNTFTEDMITGDDICQFCEEKINVRSYIEGAEVRYILDKNDFKEFLDEEKINIPKSGPNISEKQKVIQFETGNILEQKKQIQRSEKVNREKKVQLFISHSSRDIAYINHFVNFLEELGFDDSNMFCSSVEGYGISWGNDIYDYLEETFNNQDNDLMILFMLSDNYYASAACLNEMGASWVLKKDYRSILLPGFEFSDIKGAINPRKMAIKLDDKDLMTKLNDVREQLTEIFGLKNISSTKWDRIRTEFITNIYSIKPKI